MLDFGFFEPLLGTVFSLVMSAGFVVDDSRVKPVLVIFCEGCFVRCCSRCRQPDNVLAKTGGNAIRESPVRRIYVARDGGFRGLPLVCTDAGRTMVDRVGVWVDYIGVRRGQSQGKVVELSAQSDFRSSDMRFGNNSGACIGGDHGHGEIEPNRLEDV